MVQISHRVEPELQLPTPRRVRIRSYSGPQDGPTAEVRSMLGQLLPFLSVLFLIPALWGLYFVVNLIKSVSILLVGAPGPPHSAVDLVPLLIITPLWNLIGLPVTWHGFIKPLIHLGIVKYGHAAIGRVTGVSVGVRTCWITYLFYPEKGFGQLGTAEVDRREWEASGSLNAEITILFLRNRPKWNLPYRYCRYEVILNDGSVNSGP